MQAARDILLLAAEDAFEFERWRESGPVIGDIDPEARAAEIAEFQALAIPMPDELDSLRRELEHAPKVREAIHNSAAALRRNGRATASALVALGPQQLMHPHMMRAFAGMLDPRFAAFAGAEPRVAQIYEEEPEPPARTRRPRQRKLADVAVVDEEGPLEAEVVEREKDEDDDLDHLDHEDDDDETEEVEVRPPARKREAERPSKAARPEPRRAKPAPAQKKWDDEDDEPTDSMSISMAVAQPRSSSADRNTMILGGVAAFAVIALLIVVFKDKDDGDKKVAAEQPVVQQQQLPPAPAPTPPPAPAIDPNTGLPYGQMPPPVANAPEPAHAAARGGGRGSGVRGGSGGTAPISAPAGGGVNPFADYKTPADPAGMGGTTPGTQPQPQPQPADATQPPADQPPAPTDGSAPAPAPTDQQPAPAEPPKSDDSLLTKSKMTPAIREAVVSKVGDLQACYQDAIVGKPDLAGKVVFTISLDQDGVVTKVDIGSDAVGYGVAKCSAKKIKRWTLPSAGIPIIFDLPFDFKS